jgi:hypothetical protein
MTAKKSLLHREKELQALIKTPEGRDELQQLGDRYAEVGGRVRPPRTSIITFILVYERERGLIDG